VKQDDTAQSQDRPLRSQPEMEYKQKEEERQSELPGAKPQDENIHAAQRRSEPVMEHKTAPSQDRRPPSQPEMQYEQTETERQSKLPDATLQVENIQDAQRLSELVKPHETAPSQDRPPRSQPEMQYEQKEEEEERQSELPGAKPQAQDVQRLSEPVKQDETAPSQHRQTLSQLQMQYEQTEHEWQSKPSDAKPQDENIQGAQRQSEPVMEHETAPSQHGQTPAQLQVQSIQTEKKRQSELPGAKPQVDKILDEQKSAPGTLSEAAQSPKSHRSSVQIPSSHAQQHSDERQEEQTLEVDVASGTTHSQGSRRSSKHSRSSRVQAQADVNQGDQMSEVASPSEAARSQGSQQLSDVGSGTEKTESHGSEEAANKFCSCCHLTYALCRRSHSARPTAQTEQEQKPPSLNEQPQQSQSSHVHPQADETEETQKSEVGTRSDIVRSQGSRRSSVHSQAPNTHPQAAAVQEDRNSEVGALSETARSQGTRRRAVQSPPSGAQPQADETLVLSEISQPKLRKRSSSMTSAASGVCSQGVADVHAGSDVVCVVGEGLSEVAVESSSSRREDRERRSTKSVASQPRCPAREEREDEAHCEPPTIGSDCSQVTSFLVEAPKSERTPSRRTRRPSVASVASSASGTSRVRTATEGGSDACSPVAGPRDGASGTASHQSAGTASAGRAAAEAARGAGGSSANSPESLGSTAGRRRSSGWKSQEARAEQQPQLEAASHASSGEGSAQSRGRARRTTTSLVAEDGTEVVKRVFVPFPPVPPFPSLSDKNEVGGIGKQGVGDQVQPSVTEGSLGFRYRRADCRFTRRCSPNFVGIDAVSPTSVTLCATRPFTPLTGLERTHVLLLLDQSAEALNGVRVLHRGPKSEVTTKELQALLGDIGKKFVLHTHALSEANEVRSVDGVPVVLLLAARLVEVLDVLILPEEAGAIAGTSSSSSSSAAMRCTNGGEARPFYSEAAVVALNFCLGQRGFLPQALKLLSGGIVGSALRAGGAPVLADELAVHAAFSVRLLLSWSPPAGSAQPCDVLLGSKSHHEALLTAAASHFSEDAGDRESVGAAFSLGHLAVELSALALSLRSDKCVASLLRVDRKSSKSSFSQRMTSLISKALQRAAETPIPTHTDDSKLSVEASNQLAARDAAAVAAIRLLLPLVEVPVAAVGVEPAKVAEFLNDVVRGRPLTLPLASAARDVVQKASRKSGGFFSDSSGTFGRRLRKALGEADFCSQCVQAAQESLAGTMPGPTCVRDEGARKTLVERAAQRQEKAMRMVTLYQHVEFIAVKVHGSKVGEELVQELRALREDELASSGIADDTKPPPKRGLQLSLVSLQRTLTRKVLAPSETQ